MWFLKAGESFLVDKGAMHIVFEWDCRSLVFFLNENSSTSVAFKLLLGSEFLLNRVSGWSTGTLWLWFSLIHFLSQVYHHTKRNSGNFSNARFVITIYTSGRQSPALYISRYIKNNKLRKDGMFFFSLASLGLSLGIILRFQLQNS